MPVDGIEHRAGGDPGPDDGDAGLDGVDGPLAEGGLLLLAPPPTMQVRPKSKR